MLVLAHVQPDKPAEKLRLTRRKQPQESSGDPRHAPLRDALIAAHAEAKGQPYAFAGGRDAKALAELLALADQNPATRGEAAPAEILRRWVIALRWRGFPACTGLASFRDNWNAYVAPQPETKPAATGDRPRLGPAPAPVRIGGDRPRIP